jgi:hypothetical protein
MFLICVFNIIGRKEVSKYIEAGTTRNGFDAGDGANSFSNAFESRQEN